MKTPLIKMLKKSATEKAWEENQKGLAFFSVFLSIVILAIIFFTTNLFNQLYIIKDGVTDQRIITTGKLLQYSMPLIVAIGLAMLIFFPLMLAISRRATYSRKYYLPLLKSADQFFTTQLTNLSDLTNLLDAEILYFKGILDWATVKNDRGYAGRIWKQTLQAKFMRLESFISQNVVYQIDFCNVAPPVVKLNPRFIILMTELFEDRRPFPANYDEAKRGLDNYLTMAMFELEDWLQKNKQDIRNELAENFPTTNH